MPRKPNYNFEKTSKERDRREKKEEKLRRRKEKSEARSIEEAAPETEGTDESPGN